MSTYEKTIRGHVWVQASKSVFGIRSLSNLLSYIADLWIILKVSIDIICDAKHRLGSDLVKPSLIRNLIQSLYYLFLGWGVRFTAFNANIYKTIKNSGAELLLFTLKQARKHVWTYDNDSSCILEKGNLSKQKTRVPARKGLLEAL